MDEATKYLLGQGVLGVVCFFLGWAYWRQNSLISVLYEKRVEEMRQIQKETLTAIQEITRALERLTELLKAKG